MLTINPWVGADNSSLWKLQLDNRLHHRWVQQSRLLNLQKFVIVTVGVEIWSEADVALDFANGKIDNCFMETILSRRQQAGSATSRDPSAGGLTVFRM